MRGHSILAACEQCGAPVHTYTSRRLLGFGRFCSSRCGALAQPRPKTPIATRLLQGVIRDDEGCWRREFSVNAVSGYSQLTADGRRDYAHRVALAMALGQPLPKGFFALHTCDVRTCIRNDDPGVYVIRGIARPRFGHLWLGTHRDNMADMEAKGRGAIGDRSGHRTHPEAFPRGECAPWAKLTDAAVAEMRHRYALGGVSQQRLAREFGVSFQMVSRIVRHLSWAHLP